MYQFHVNVFADPAEISFETKWEQVAELLAQLPRMIFELDGSFVISGVDEQERRWQVDGHLFDFHERLYRVELRGNCPGTTFDELLTCLGWPAQKLRFELVSEGTTVDEADFRRQLGDFS